MTKNLGPIAGLLGKHVNESNDYNWMNEDLRSKKSDKNSIGSNNTIEKEKQLRKDKENSGNGNDSNIDSQSHVSSIGNGVNRSVTGVNTANQSKELTTNDLDQFKDCEVCFVNCFIFVFDCFVYV